MEEVFCLVIEAIPQMMHVPLNSVDRRKSILEAVDTVVSVVRSGAAGPMAVWEEPVAKAYAAIAAKANLAMYVESLFELKRRKDREGKKMTLVEIKDVLRQAGLPLNGNKAEILSRTPRLPPPSLLRFVLAEHEAERKRRLRDRPPGAPLPNDPNARITATRAKTEFRLTENDLLSLNETLVRNPHYRSAAPMRLYLLSDVVAASHEKHGGPEGLVAAREKAQASTAKRRHTLEEKEAAKRARHNDEVAQRRVQLEAAFAPRNLEIRRDSELCQRYLTLGIGNPTNIARIMDEMRFYFARTQYASKRDELFEQHLEHYGYYPDPIELSEDAREEALDDFIHELNSLEKVDAALADDLLPPTLRPAIEKRRLVF